MVRAGPDGSGDGVAGIPSPLHYGLELEIDYTAGLLRADVEILLENRSPVPIRSVPLLLYKDLLTRTVRTEDGLSLAFRQAVAEVDGFPELRVNFIIVDLEDPLPGGGRTGLRIRYDGPLHGYVETGMLYVRDRIDREFTILRDDCFAFPIPAVPSRSALRAARPWRRFTYSCRIVLPAELAVACGGRAVGTENLGTSRAFRYESRRPSWRMDFAIARYEERTAGFLRLFHLPHPPGEIDGFLRSAMGAWALCTRWFGACGTDGSLTFIELPDGWGSQADADVILQTTPAFLDNGRRYELYHEICHLWDVPDRDAPSPRWNEGMASFLQHLIQEELDGKAAVDAAAAGRLERLRRGLPDHPEWSRFPALEYGCRDMTGLSYRTGAAFFDLAYRLHGRARFLDMLRRGRLRFTPGGARLQDFVDFWKAESAGLSALCDDWILGTGWSTRILEIQAAEELAKWYASADGQ